MGKATFTMRITGTGTFLPDWTYDSSEVARMWGDELDGGDFGIRQRRWAGELDVEAMTVHPGPLGPDPHRTMAVRAGERALGGAKVDPAEVDALILCSCTQPIEGARFATAVTGVQHDLGLEAEAHVLELTGGSASSIYALQAVEKCLRAGDRNVLLVAVNAATAHLSPAYRDLSPAYTSTIFIFGDGAGAFLFSGSGSGDADTAASQGAETVLRVQAHVHETREAQKLQIGNETGGGQVLYRIDQSGVARSVLRGIPAITEKLEARMAEIEDRSPEPDYFLFHQANSRLLEKLIERMGVEAERVLTDIETVGNMGPAEPLVLLGRAMEEGTLTAGDRVWIATVGAGEQRSAASVRVGG